MKIQKIKDAMQKIKQLPNNEAEKIAAGEVVDRPANVVKELVENSIDAHATHVKIFIKDGGKQLIRVVDNGCGMSIEDAHFCCKHHATSKISSVDDLTTISTFGFRGEALSSVSSVSTVILKTKELNTEAGIQLNIQHGTLTKEKTISCSHGTDIAIHDLFANVPARKKFLKTRETEWRNIVQLFYSFCLCHTSIHFELHNDEKQIHNCPPVKNITERIAQLWDHHLIQNMLELQPTNNKKDISITGAISNHSYSRFDRSMIFLFVNNRWIKDIHVSRALLRGYTNVLQPAQYPFACINIEINPEDVDINTHPRKEEIKFLHPRIVETTLQQQVKETLQAHLSAQLKPRENNITPPKHVHVEINPKPTHAQPSFDFYKQPFEQTNEGAPLHTTNQKILKSVRGEHVEPYEHQIIPFESFDPSTKLRARTNGIKNNAKPKPLIQQETVETKPLDFMIIGQLHKTYILIEQEDGLFVVDQHAAHERILYEQFRKRFKDVARIKLLFPPVITVSQDDLATIEPYLEQFKAQGIDIAVFGTNQLIIHATPISLQHIDFNDLVKKTIGWVNELHNLDTQELTKALNEKIHAKMACAAAVKAGDTLTLQQMQKLVYDLEKTENRLTCPHGRPTGWLLPFKEVEKRFKRDYRSQSSSSIQE